VPSLCIPSPHAALYDRGEFIGCTCSVPSPMTLAFAQSPLARHSQNSHHPFPMGGWFRGFPDSLLAAACRVACPPDGSDRELTQPTGTFTPELPASRSPFSSSGITTVATERFHRWDFHPLECQLASLHRLFHPLLHAGLSRRTAMAMLRHLPHGDAGQKHSGEVSLSPILDPPPPFSPRTSTPSTERTLYPRTRPKSRVISY
jgi:hypothetical protein